MDLPDKRIKCPYTGHKKSCCDLAIHCPKWVQIQGKHPQTGKDIDKWGCADTFVVMMQIETTQQIRQLGAATESMRNEIVKHYTAIGVNLGRSIAKYLPAYNNDQPMRSIDSISKEIES